MDARGSPALVPFRDTAGRMTGMGAIVRDVTRRFEELKTLRKALAEPKA
jgi:hypothetical protein